MVFRKYLTFLIREGYTQEFFIEGGRHAHRQDARAEARHARPRS